MTKVLKEVSGILLLVLIPAFGLTAQDADNPLAASDTLDNSFGLFENDDILNLAIRFDTKLYMRKKPKEEYLPAILTYYINEKDSVNREIRLRSRGEFRNAYCDFPPLSLNFKKADFEKSDLKKIGKIKVVTHCQYGNEEYLFKEYLVYKLFNVLTDSSFRVRLAKVDYINNVKESKIIHTYCFFIEPKELLGERMKAVPVDAVNITQQKIIPSMMDRLAIFNYMIGNTDWSVPNQHNVQVFSGNNFKNPGMGMIVPYDFDYAGLVDASYAVPFEGLGLESVRQRRYLGACRTEDEFKAALSEFPGKKEAFYRVINEFPLLSVKEKERMLKYLDEFFNGLEKGKSVLNDLRSGCYDFNN